VRSTNNQKRYDEAALPIFYWTTNTLPRFEWRGRYTYSAHSSLLTLYNVCFKFPTVYHLVPGVASDTVEPYSTQLLWIRGYKNDFYTIIDRLTKRVENFLGNGYLCSKLIAYGLNVNELCVGPIMPGKIFRIDEYCQMICEVKQLMAMVTETTTGRPLTIDLVLKDYVEKRRKVNP
jgi:hypothetical protein